MSIYFLFPSANPEVQSCFTPGVVYEMMKMTKSMYGRQRDISLVHGYSATQIHYENGVVEYFPNPRDTSSTFPEIESLSETLYKGLNILAGTFPIETISWLRYPPERSFEDGGMNEKLLLQSSKRHEVRLADRQPLTVKHFHRSSMSEINNLRGGSERIGKVGPYVVRGIRADIVAYYGKVMDYFVGRKSYNIN